MFITNLLKQQLAIKIYQHIYLVSIHLKMELLFRIYIIISLFFSWTYLYFLQVYMVCANLGGFGCPRYSTPEIRTAVPCGLPFHLRGSAFGSGVQFAGPWNPEKWGCWDGWVVWVSAQRGENWWHLDVFWEIREVWFQFCGFVAQIFELLSVAHIMMKNSVSTCSWRAWALGETSSMKEFFWYAQKLQKRLVWKQDLSYHGNEPAPNMEKSDVSTR